MLRPFNLKLNMLAVLLLSAKNPRREGACDLKWSLIEWRQKLFVYNWSANKHVWFKCCRIVTCTLCVNRYCLANC